MSKEELEAMWRLTEISVFNDKMRYQLDLMMIRSSAPFAPFGLAILLGSIVGVTALVCLLVLALIH